jgi:hypothetical protein
LEAGKLIDQSPSAITFVSKQILLQKKTLPFFPFPEEVLPRRRKQKQKKKEKKRKEKDNGTIIP